MSTSAIRSIPLLGVLAVLICTACGIHKGEGPIEPPPVHTMTMVVYLNHESEAARTWKNEGKGSPNEARIEFAQDGPIEYWWDSVEPMPLTEGETETLLWAIANGDDPQVTIHIFIGDSPASRLSYLLAQASKAAIGNDRSLVIKNQFVSCGPSGL